MLRLQPYAYHRPDTVADAARLLAEHAGDAMIIAGGTDLVPNMKHRLFTPGHVVALKNIAELRGIEVRGGVLEIGATESLTTISRHPLVRMHAPSLAEAAGLIAGPQLRNMGTIGGNICLDTRCTYYNQTWFWRQALGFCLKKDGDVCHVTKTGKKCVAAHSADTPPVLMTLGASVDLESSQGSRTVPVADLFIADGIWNSVRQPGEILVRVRVPVPPARTRMAFRKLRQRNAIDFPLLNVAVAVDENEDGTITDVRLVVSALGSRPRLVSGLDRIVAGRQLNEDVIEEIAMRAHAQCHPLTNIIVDMDWRRAMVPVYVRRALEALRPAALHAA
jgi:4-hydroxybenzoyl-CoA reductase subunit beta